MSRATLAQISAAGGRTPSRSRGLRAGTWTSTDPLPSPSNGSRPGAREGKFDYIPGVLAGRPTCGATVQPLLGKHGKGHPSGGKS
jgi:hypothetical protein